VRAAAKLSGVLRVSVSRRAVLAALVSGAASLGGCGLIGDREPPRPPPPHPLEPVLAGTQALIGQYDAAIAANPALGARLQPLRDAHQTHVAELSKAMGKPVPGTSAPATSPAASAGTPGKGPDLAALVAAEQAAVQDGTTACLAAQPKYAALLGSIVACRATHAEALK